MKELKDLADKLLVMWILDHEAYRSKIQQIFQHIKDSEAMMSFFVHIIMFILRLCMSIEMDQNGDQHPANGN